MLVIALTIAVVLVAALVIGAIFELTRRSVTGHRMEEELHLAADAEPLRPLVARRAAIAVPEASPLRHAA